MALNQKQSYLKDDSQQVVMLRQNHAAVPILCTLLLIQTTPGVPVASSSLQNYAYYNTSFLPYMTKTPSITLN